MAIYVPLIGSFLDINEMIVVFCIVIIAYLAVMHIEFRQLRQISRKYSTEETELSKCIRDLKSEMTELGDILRSREIKKIGAHVSGSKAPKEAADAKDTKVEEKAVSADSESKASPEKDPDADDTKSLQDMLDTV